MSADNPRNPGERPDPDYQGAKPASVSGPSDFWASFGMAGAPPTHHPLSAALARNWWLGALRRGLPLLFRIVAIFPPGPTPAPPVVLFPPLIVGGGLPPLLAP